jgi:hypothetical protein
LVKIELVFLDGEDAVVGALIFGVGDFALGVEELEGFEGEAAGRRRSGGRLVRAFDEVIEKEACPEDCEDQNGDADNDCNDMNPWR